MTRILPLLLLPLVPACASGAHLRTDDALAAESIEVAVDHHGHPTEIEYHVLPEAVPETVHAAFEALHPGGETVAGEKEYEGSTLYWELAKDIDGFRVEAMFLPDGTLHSEEVGVNASSVPPAVRRGLGDAWGEVTAWEQIRDENQDLVEFHAKTTRDGRDYKVRLSLDGDVLTVFREMAAEIEVPVPLER